MDVARVLFIGRTQLNQPTLIAALEKRYRLAVAGSGKLGVERAAQDQFQAIVLDAASMRTPGDRVCRELRDTVPGTALIHIHPGPKARARSSADALLFHPFSVRKLVNTIERLIQTKDNELITCGPFSVNLGRRVLTVNGQDIQLTPKQALLVETFFRNPGTTLDRATLMEKVWQTDYLGDTRTLDVHIRWIRQILEADPSKPRYIRTVRGVGYRLETGDETQVVTEALEALPAL